MRLNRGCGCPVLILLIADVVLVVGAILSLAQGPDAEPTKATTLGSVFSFIVMSGNVIVCAIVAIAALRRGTLGSSSDGNPDGEMESDSPEGSEADDVGDGHEGEI